MAKKDVCCICSEELEYGFMEKLKGTILKVRKTEDSDLELCRVCDSCQKKYASEELREQVVNSLK